MRIRDSGLLTSRVVSGVNVIDAIGIGIELSLRDAAEAVNQRGVDEILR